MNVNEQRIIAFLTEKCCYLNLRSKVHTQLRWCGKFYHSPCRISSRLKWYKNYKNRLRLAKVIVKTKLPRFFLVHCVVSKFTVESSSQEIWYVSTKKSIWYTMKAGRESHIGGCTPQSSRYTPNIRPPTRGVFTVLSGVAWPLAAWCGGQICRPIVLGFGKWIAC